MKNMFFSTYILVSHELLCFFVVVVESGSVSHKKYECFAAHVKRILFNNCMNASIILQNNINALSIIHYNVKYKSTVYILNLNKKNFKMLFY